MVLRPLALCVGLFLPLAGQPPATTAPLEAQLDELFADWNREDRPGGAAVVVKDGKVVYLKGFGLACIEHPKPNTPKTAFDTGSLTQPFTGAAVALLVHQGKLSLEDPLSKHVPHLPPVCAGLTVRHLLEHRSGLPDFNTPLRMTGWSEQDTLALPQVLRLLGMQKQLAFPPGTRTQAAAINYVLLGEVVRAASGASLRDYTWQHLFRPLKMTQTLVRDNPREIMDGRAFYYNFHSRDGYLRGADGMGVVGSHGLFTSADDLGKWLVALDAGTLPVAKTLLSPAPGAATWYGLQVGRHKGLPRLQYLGSWAGLKAAIEIYPEQHLAMAVLANWDYNFHHPLQHTDGIADLFLKEETKPEPAPAAPAQVDPKRLEALKGEYRIMASQTFTLQIEGSKVVLVSGGQPLPLEPTGVDTWRHAPYGITLRIPSGQTDTCYLDFGRGEELTCPRIVRGVPTPAELEALVGTYACAELDITLTVALQNGKLVAQHPRLGALPLRPESRDVYYGTGPFALVRFTREGAAPSFVVDQDDARQLVFRRR